MTECRRQQGFTLIELVVVISIVVVLVGMLLQRVWIYQEHAEKTAMMQVAGGLQSALTMQYGSLMTHGKEAQVGRLVTENPMSWLQKVPHNYAGEFYDPTPRSVAPGSWVFDLKSRELIYVVDRGAHFSPDKDGNKWVRYHVHLAYDPPLDSNGVTGQKILSGVVFVPVAPYSWFRKEGG